VAVATTAVSAVAAHQAWERYSALAVIYQATADRLAELKAAFLDDAERGTPERAARFIDDCERAISSQNESWLAAWSRDPDTR
jgi:predicted pyridoxine 5'-phosphate oxidase superfamily flavin-nucleotide-binding protein